MKNLFDFVTGSSTNLFLVCIFLFFVVFFIISISKKFTSFFKEMKLQKHPLSFGVEHINCYFKILKINEKKGIIYLGYNPTVPHPFGVGGGWFNINNIPKELRNECSVIFVNKGTKDDYVCNKGPIF